MSSALIRNIFACLSVLVGLSLLSGCQLFSDDGMFRNKEKDYLNSREVPVIVVPGEEGSAALGQLYVVPEIPSSSLLLEGDVHTPRPQPLSGSLLEEEVKVQQLGEKRWILINRTPSEVWPRVRNVLSRNSIPTAHANAAVGRLETVWLKLKGDDSLRHRFRLQIEPGIQEGSTEISVVHMGLKPGDEFSAWPLTSDNDEREHSMANMVASALAGDDVSSTVSLLAQSIGGGAKVELLTPEGKEPYILLKLDYDRAWASVGYSVGREGFTRIDQDRSEGVFYVNYGAVEVDEPGFFAGLFGADSTEERLNVNYHVRLKKGDDGTEVRISDGDKKALERVQAMRLLKKIRANLS